MNIDHFSWIDTEDVRAGRYDSKSVPRRVSEKAPRNQSTFISRLLSAMHFSWESDQKIAKKKKDRLLNELLEDYQGLPKASKINVDDFVIINVSPSVVPTYFPGIRVYTYNVTAPAAAAYIPAGGGDAGGSGLLSPYDEALDGAEAGAIEMEGLVKQSVPSAGKRYDPFMSPLFLCQANSDHHNFSLRITKKLDCRKEKNRNKKKCRLKKPRYANETSPSRINTLWTLLGYSQV